MIARESQVLVVAGDWNWVATIAESHMKDLSFECGYFLIL